MVILTDVNLTKRGSTKRGLTNQLSLINMSLELNASMFDFFKELSENNTRDWFQLNKERYQQHYDAVVSFSESLLIAMNKTDTIETPSGKKAVFRIYKDVRFSKDKTPYKTHISAGFKRASSLRRGSYYLHIEQGNSFIGGGFWDPTPADLKHIRHQIAAEDNRIRKILSSSSFITHFGSLQGDKLITSPKGFDKNHKALDLLKYKQFLLMKRISDEDVLSSHFLNQVVEGFNAMLPFLDCMSEMLTTDLNGAPLAN